MKVHFVAGKSTSSSAEVITCALPVVAKPSSSAFRIIRALTWTEDIEQLIIVTGVRAFLLLLNFFYDLLYWDMDWLGFIFVFYHYYAFLGQVVLVVGVDADVVDAGVLGVVTALLLYHV